VTAEEQTRSLMDLRHAATDRATFVVVGPRRFFAIDGIGPPTSADFRFALEPLRNVAERARTIVLPRLTPAEKLDLQPPIPECLWWHRDLATPDELAAAIDDRSSWHWRQLMEVPQAARDEEADRAIADAARAAGRPTPLVRVARIAEGRAAQILHRGGSATIGEPLRRLYTAIAAEGATAGRLVHELRLADERLVPANRAHLILRVTLDPVGSAV
jgi:hypothetical protein